MSWRGSIFGLFNFLVENLGFCWVLDDDGGGWNDMKELGGIFGRCNEIGVVLFVCGLC